jgi:hypothetical protein
MVRLHHCQPASQIYNIIDTIESIVIVCIHLLFSAAKNCKIVLDYPHSLNNKQVRCPEGAFAVQLTALTLQVIHLKNSTGELFYIIIYNDVAWIHDSKSWCKIEFCRHMED